MKHWLEINCFECQTPNFVEVKPISDSHILGFKCHYCLNDNQVDDGQVLPSGLDFEEGFHIPLAHTYQYLAVLNYEEDDVPLLLTDCVDSAFSFIEDIDWDFYDTRPLAGILDLPEEDELLASSIITFRDGTPCSRVIVKEYEDE